MPLDLALHLLNKIVQNMFLSSPGVKMVDHFSGNFGETDPDGLGFQPPALKKQQSTKLVILYPTNQICTV